MELNGVANIDLIIRMALDENTECHQSISVEVADKILDQLDVLNRYMTAIAKTMEPEHEELIPAWHEVREERHKYVNNKGERGLKK